MRTDKCAYMYIRYFSLAILVVLLYSLSGCSEQDRAASTPVAPHSNPCQSTVADIDKSVKTIERIDDAGILYSMTYLGDYYSEDLAQLMENTSINIDVGCSSFMTYNTNDDVLSCRNYDYKHYDKNGNPTGLLLALYCSPKEKYKSLATVDPYWFDPINKTFVQGSLDDGETDLSPLVVSPYFCVDGINEKGLSVATSKLNIKDGETPTHQQEPGKETIFATVLLRYLLDECATLEEAIKVAESYNIMAFGDIDMHLFVTDATGKSAVFEWRYNQFHVIETNAVTNFYVGSDDAEPYYNDEGQLQEMPLKLQNTDKEYHYGYGHGYHRFAGMVAKMERFIDYSTPDHRVIMDEALAKDILCNVSQELEIEGTSQTLASIIFNTTQLNATYWVWRQYDKPYTLYLD